jgi:hypothetical protein
MFVHSYQSQNAKPKVTDRFHDGRRRHVGNSSAFYKMGNYQRILMKIGTQVSAMALHYRRRYISLPHLIRCSTAQL